MQHVLKRLFKNNNVILYNLLEIFLSDYTCDILNITYKYPLKCMLIEENER